MAGSRSGVTVRGLMAWVAVLAVLLAPAAFHRDLALAAGVLLFVTIVATGLALLLPMLRRGLRGLLRDLAGPSA